MDINIIDEILVFGEEGFRNLIYVKLSIVMKIVVFLKSF